MSTYIHDEVANQGTVDEVNPPSTYHQPSAQPFTYSQPATQPFVQHSAHSSLHSSTPMSAQTSLVEATYPAGPASAYATFNAGDSTNNNQVAYGQHYSAQVPEGHGTFGQSYSGHNDSATMTNNNNFGEHYSGPTTVNANLRTINAVSSLDTHGNQGVVAQHGFAQNNALAAQHVDFQGLANIHSMNNMIYYPQQHMFMPQLPFNAMMPFQYGPHYNMYGQLYNTPSLPVMEPSVQNMMGPPSTILSSVENWRHRVSSPAADSNTTGISGHQKISPHIGLNPSGFDNSFNPAVLAVYNAIPTSEVEDKVVTNSSPVDVKPAMKKKKKSSKTRTCFVCTGFNNDDMVNCAHPDHKGTTMFHLDCAGLSSKSDNGK